MSNSLSNRPGFFLQLFLDAFLELAHNMNIYKIYIVTREAEYGKEKRQF